MDVAWTTGAGALRAGPVHPARRARPGCPRDRSPMP